MFLRSEPSEPESESSSGLAPTWRKCWANRSAISAPVSQCTIPSRSGSWVEHPRRQQNSHSTRVHVREGVVHGEGLITVCCTPRKYLGLCEKGRRRFPRTNFTKAYPPRCSRLFICPGPRIRGQAALFSCPTTESSPSPFRLRTHCAIFVLWVRDHSTLQACKTRPKPHNKRSMKSPELLPLLKSVHIEIFCIYGVATGNLPNDVHFDFLLA